MIIRVQQYEEHVEGNGMRAVVRHRLQKGARVVALVLGVRPPDGPEVDILKEFDETARRLGYTKTGDAMPGRAATASLHVDAPAAGEGGVS